MSVSTLSDGPSITSIDGRGGRAEESHRRGESPRAFIALAPARTIAINDRRAD
jgi:hypothetical protein